MNLSLLRYAALTARYVAGYARCSAVTALESLKSRTREHGSSLAVLALCALIYVPFFYALATR